ncbi:fimbrillin family protein [Halosquirtibacter xylanolyticus]|uniref:fimbrillin family protein n=1 Tax=Halosquirtibacter xylanolyticus TaxID=3374599 RepID=UPI0037483CA4|nr:fimbrillin family protein [Prolixibacteraceae bacterium]
MKTTITIQIFTIGFMIILFTSCSNDVNHDSNNLMDKKQVTFTTSIKSLESIDVTKRKTAFYGISFNNDDKIGIYSSTATLAASGNYFENISYTSDASDNISLSEGETPVYWPTNISSLNFFAYHPYKEGGVDAGTTTLSFSVALNQNIGNSAFDYDLVYAKSLGVTSGADIPLSFEHKLCRVAVQLFSGTETLITNQIDSVVINNVYKNVELNLASGDLTIPSQPKVNIRLDLFDAGQNFTSIIPPIDEATDVEIAVYRNDGNSFIASLPSTTFQGGYSYKYNVFLDKKVISVSPVTVGYWWSEDSQDVNATSTN